MIIGVKVIIFVVVLTTEIYTKKLLSEKKSVLAFYGISEEQQKAIVESYNGNPEGYKASIQKMPEKEREVSLLIASACGIDINNF